MKPAAGWALFLAAVLALNTAVVEWVDPVADGWTWGWALRLLILGPGFTAAWFGLRRAEFDLGGSA